MTDNLAERTLRHWVISRRISQGTRTEQGPLVFSLLAGVIQNLSQARCLAMALPCPGGQAAANRRAGPPCCRNPPLSHNR